MLQRPWLASYGAIPAEIDADRSASVHTMLMQAINDFSAKTAFRAFGQSLTYREVGRQANALAAYLQHVVGVRKGDRVAVMLPNVFAFPIAFIAIAKLGAVQVNVNPLYTTRELEHQLNDSGATSIIIFDGATSTLAEVIGRTQVGTVITAGLADGGTKPVQGPPVDARLLNAVPFEKAIKKGAALKPADAATVHREDILILQYTGGTTGPSKGAALSNRNLLANIEQFRAFMPDALRPGEEVLVTAIPMYHIFALMANFLSYFSAGAENWLLSNPREIDGFIDTLKSARPTVFLGVNTLFAGLASHPGLADVDWSRLRLSIGGGAAVLRTTSQRWKAVTGNFIREGYGLSETSPVVSLSPQYVDHFTGTTGLPMPSTDILLLNEADQAVGIGESGEICVKGPQVMRGYWEKPEVNATAFTQDGYFRTGDIGALDARGFLKVVDRKKDMIIVSGFNVYPNEVEAVASEHAAVAECACVGEPDERSGEAVKLFVVKVPSACATEDSIIAHCRSALAGYKVPRSVRFVDSLPKSAVGKILRRELRDGR